MSRKLDRGVCENCRRDFSYFLVHNGFNDTLFAYCDSCPYTTLLSRWYERIPKTARLHAQGPIAQELEQLLRPCGCGGKFRGSAHPRCPHCNGELSAVVARSWIEANAPGTASGWRWDGAWSGYYSIVIENRMVTDNWRDDVA